MIRVFVLIYFVLQNVQAQEVVSLFRDDSLKTFVSLPFLLKDSQGKPQSVFSVEVTSSKENCMAMLDPFINSNFLVKCTQPDSLTMNVYYKNNGQIIKINYGPIIITKISETATVLAPIVDSSLKYKEGRDLFEANCLSCHAPADKPDRTVTQIKNAISSKPQMRSISLTDAQIQAISDYLKNL